jgi:transposase-like protein
MTAPITKTSKMIPFETDTEANMTECSLTPLIKQLTKTKGAFPNENTLLKLLYAGISHVSSYGRYLSITGILHYFNQPFILMAD